MIYYPRVGAWKGVTGLTENQMEEHVLIKRLKEGDPVAIDEIVEKYKRQLFAFILRMVNNNAEAEDLFQETWLRVIRNVYNFRGDSKFSTWLFQIAVNLCRDAKSKRSCCIHVPIEDYEEVLSCEQDFDVMRTYKAGQVRKIVASLPEKMREVIVLRYFHDLSYAEIAEIAGCPLGTVKSRFYHASEIIREKWERINK